MNTEFDKKRSTFWRLPSGDFDLRRPVFMGIVNVTPDSFSDGGRFLDPDAALSRVIELIDAGAGIIDLGAESTRPGSDGVEAEEELSRLVPVLKAIRESVPPEKRVPVSIDTVKPEVALACLELGAEIVNDVSGTPGPEMVRVLLRSGAGYCLMHSRGIPKTMQDDPRYENVVEEIFRFLTRGREELIAAGVEPERIALDPGLGFGKTIEHNWEIVEKVDRFHEWGAPLLVGHSRKRFISETFSDRDHGTDIVTGKLIEKGVQIIRLHEIPGGGDG